MSAADIEAVANFDSEYDSDAYEAKIARLLRRAYRDMHPDGPGDLEVTTGAGSRMAPLIRGALGCGWISGNPEATLTRANLRKSTYAIGLVDRDRHQ